MVHSTPIDSNPSGRFDSESIDNAIQIIKSSSHVYTGTGGRMEIFGEKRGASVRLTESGGTTLAVVIEILDPRSSSVLDLAKRAINEIEKRSEFLNKLDQFRTEGKLSTYDFDPGTDQAALERLISNVSSQMVTSSDISSVHPHQLPNCLRCLLEEGRPDLALEYLDTFSGVWSFGNSLSEVVEVLVRSIAIHCSRDDGFSSFMWLSLAHLPELRNALARVIESDESGEFSELIKRFGRLTKGLDTETRATLHVALAKNRNKSFALPEETAQYLVSTGLEGDKLWRLKSLLDLPVVSTGLIEKLERRCDLENFPKVALVVNPQNLEHQRLVERLEGALPTQYPGEMVKLYTKLLATFERSKEFDFSVLLPVVRQYFATIACNQQLELPSSNRGGLIEGIQWSNGERKPEDQQFLNWIKRCLTEEELNSLRRAGLE